MNREQAETLLAVLVAGELDEPYRSELLAYLKTDPALAERLGDMRFAAGLLREGLEQASADAPAALDDAQRAELLALAEREPIVAVLPPRGGSTRSLFSIRIAGAIAACLALAVGLLGMMLPELGEARRTARRMQSDGPTHFEYFSVTPGEPESNSPHDRVPRHAIASKEPLADVSGRLGILREDSIEFRAGTRLAINDGYTSDLLNEVTGTLALGDGPDDDISIYADRSASGFHTPQQSAQQAPNTEVTTRDPGDSLTRLYAADQRRNYWKRGMEDGLASMIEGQLPATGRDRSLAGEEIASVGQSLGDVDEKPSIVTVAPNFGPVVDPSREPTDSNASFSIDIPSDQPTPGRFSGDTVVPSDLIPDSPSFADAPGFDLNSALSNTNSGGSGGGGHERSGQLFDESDTRGVIDRVATDRSDGRQSAIADYEKAMAKAAESLEKQDFSAANNAALEARMILSRERQVLDTTEYNARVNRANQFQNLTQSTRSRIEADELKSIESQRRATESSIANETEGRKVEELQKHLRKARQLQQEKKYDEALTELDAAMFLEPDNAVLKGFRDMIKDTANAVESFELKRARDLEVAGQTLLNIEASTPFDNILTYPGDWPELTALRLREIETQENNTGTFSLGAGVDSDAGVFGAIRLEEHNFDLLTNPGEWPELSALRPHGLEGGNDLVTKIDPIVPIVPEPEPEPVPEVDGDKSASELIPVNPWVLTERDALSTFALDTDTASYDLARRTIRDQAQLPPIVSVRMEEFINRFDYQYPTGRDAHDTFTVHAEAGPAPFADEGVVLLKVGVRGRVVARDQMKPAHYVFVIDASGSMAREDRLALVQQSLAMLLGQLGERDTVSLVSYETRPYLLLEHAPANNAQAIMQAAATIQTGGSTNLTDGLKLGYQVAAKHFAPGSVNRVILCSDGVANVGNDDAKQMLAAVDQYRKHGVTLMTVGVGVDGQTTAEAASGAERFNDGLMEQLANRGDGQYVYLGSAEDAKRQFVEDLAATRPTIAYDAKIQVKFDPSRVRRYRLIGYENRAIADRDFRNDAVDAGEVGSGQSATALYEVELWPTPGGQIARRPIEDAASLGTVYVRYRDARSDKVQETATALSTGLVRERTVASDPRFYLAACAAEFAELLRESEHATGGSYARLHTIAREVAEALPLDKDAAELAELIGRSNGLPRAGQ